MGHCARWATIVGAIALLGLIVLAACTAGPGLEPPAEDRGGAGGPLSPSMGGGVTGTPDDFGNPPLGMGGTTGGAFGGGMATPGVHDGTSADAGASESGADAGVEDPDGGTP
jgi:hypothetical protein